MNKWTIHAKVVLAQISALLLTVVITSRLAVGAPAQTQIMGAQTFGRVTDTAPTVQIPTSTPSPSPRLEPSSTPRLPTAEAEGNGGQAAPSSSSPESQTITLINSERQRQGLSQLSTNDALTTASRRHSKDVCDHNQLNHTGTDGSDFSSRARDAGFSGNPYGEVLGMGYGSPEAVFGGWMGSSAHHDIIMNPGIHQIGMGWVGNCQTAVVAF